MSSILDALEKLERSRPPVVEPAAAAPVPVPRRRRGVVLVGAAFTAGAALALTLLRAHPGSGPVVVQVPAEPAPVKQPVVEAVVPQAQPVAPAQPIAPAAPPAEPTQPAPAPQAVSGQAPGSESPPMPQAEPSATTPPRTETAPVPDAPQPAPDVLAAARPVPAPSPTDPRPWAQAVAPPLPPPPPAANVAAPREAPATTYTHLEPPAIRRPPAGAPAVRLSFLLYSPAPGRRTVALAIENRGLETLHEGESSSEGVEVVRILPDRVELGWNGEHFTVRARD